ncbi:MAG TPA: tRNA (adenosine(37)-N6)-threonylcarbamoyltransferase complex ATPase subunit type 1 TsaE [Flavisolibacter sp.]
MVYEFTLEELPRFAGRFWKDVQDARVFAFHGAMGSGKTTIIEELCRARGVTDRMGSPTFSIINEYAYPDAGEEKPLYHIDLYRLNDEEEMVRAGVEDCVYSGNICMVEWPERAPHLFDSSAVHVYLDTTGPLQRRINIELPSHSVKEQS